MTSIASTDTHSEPLPTQSPRLLLLSVNPADPAQKNLYNGIFVHTDEVRGAVSWGETEVPVVIWDVDWWITGSLTLANDVVLKFRPGSVLKLGLGANLANYDGTGVAFPSYHDDSRKGDTNGNAAATSPASGDWGGIYNDATSLYEAWPNNFYDQHRGPWLSVIGRREAPPRIHEKG